MPAPALAPALAASCLPAPAHVCFVFIVYCVCQVAARASPAEQCVALGMMKPNRRRNRDQTTHTALNSKLKQLNSVAERGTHDTHTTHTRHTHDTHTALNSKLKQLNCGVGNDEAQSKKKQRSNHTHTTMNDTPRCDAARASPPPGLGMMKPNRRRNRDQTTHTSQ